MTRRIVILANHRVQALDVTGPASVFAAATKALGDGTSYDIEVVSPAGGLIETISGVDLHSSSVCQTSADKIDTLLVAGHDEIGTQALTTDSSTRDWFIRAASSARRWGSVCSGAFVIAAWDLLSGRRATTHWSAIDQFRDQFETTEVDPDALYVIDDELWTSAGVTSGIDMALAMVEEDFGANISAMVAKQLVVYLRRPGHQSQFSHSLEMQCDAASPYGELINWMKANLAIDLPVAGLAERVGQSSRTFQRKFAREIGSTPAAFVESLRLERAKILISSDVPLKTVAAEIGYPTPSQLSIVFQRRFGVSPSVWKRMHTEHGEPG